MKNLLKDAMHGTIKGLNAMLPTILLVLGAICVSCGAAMIYLPAGVIIAGIMMMIGAVLLIRGGGGDIYE